VFRFWYSLFFVLAVGLLSGTIAAGNEFLNHPGVMNAAILSGWVLLLAADGFMLLFQDYRRQKALGKVKTPVGIYERMLRKRIVTTDEGGRGN
jgi:hypothetical protein